MIGTINSPQFFSSEIINMLFGLLLIMLELFYLFFAFLMTRQIKLMNRSFNTPAAGVFRFLGAMHMFAAFVVLIVTIIALQF